MFHIDINVFSINIWNSISIPNTHIQTSRYKPLAEAMPGSPLLPSLPGSPGKPIGPVSPLSPRGPGKPRGPTGPGTPGGPGVPCSPYIKQQERLYVMPTSDLIHQHKVQKPHFCPSCSI